MSNSVATKRPRRSQAEHVAEGRRAKTVPRELLYDGEEAPVLIRLPDLSAQRGAETDSFPAAKEGPAPAREAAGAAHDASGQGAPNESRTRPTSRRSARELERQGSPLERSRIIIAIALFLVTALTYFMLQGNNDKQEEPASQQNWTLTTEQPAALANTAAEPAPIEESHVDLWPAAKPPAAAPRTSSQVNTDPAWNTTTPGGASPATPRITGVQPPPAAGDNAVGGWPTDLDSPHLAQPADRSQQQQPNPAVASESVQGWPDDMPETYSPAPPAGGYFSPDGGQPTARTGMRDTSAVPSDSSGTRLDGTIEIPRPESNYERDGSHLY